MKTFTPKYLEKSIIFNQTEILLQEILDYINIDFLTNGEIANILSNKCGYKIGPAAILKILKHYKIGITAETKQARKKRSVKAANERLKERYGVNNVFQLNSVKEKAAKTKLSRYGDPKYTNIEKNKQTCLRKYGVENYSSTRACREKVTNTNIKKYGAKTPAENAAIKTKIKRSCLEKFGVDNYWKSSIFKADMQERYFADNPNLTDLYKNIYKDPAKLTETINNLPQRDISCIAKLFGLSYESTYQLLLKNDLLGLVEHNYNKSHYEDEIVEFIGPKYKIILNDRSALLGQEIDIYLPDFNIGIEFNGNYWHSSAIKKDYKYHYNKSILAEKNNIHLIHIWEYEWNDPKQQAKIKLMLNIALGRVDQKIYARNCEVKQISNKEAKELNDKIHLQGHRNAQVTYGLFYNDKLMQLMSFSKTKYNKNLKTTNDWEIIRGCPGSNNIVIGGVSKLLKHFIVDYQPDKIFSYCDFNKFTGKSYLAAGMKFIGYTGPDMKWLLKDGTVVNRKPSKHTELKKVAIAKLYGAGSKKYELSLK